MDTDTGVNVRMGGLLELDVGTGPVALNASSGSSYTGQYYCRVGGVNGTIANTATLPNAIQCSYADGEPLVFNLPAGLTLPSPAPPTAPFGSLTMRLGAASSYASSVNASSAASLLSTYQQVYGAQGVRPFHSLVYSLPYTYSFSSLLGSGSASMTEYNVDGSRFSSQSYTLSTSPAFVNSSASTERLFLCVWDYPSTTSYGQFLVTVRYCDQPAGA